MPNIYQQSFWDDEAGDAWDDVAETLIEIYFSGLDGGVNALPPDLRVFVDWDLVNVNALDFAKRYKYDWIKRINDTTRTQTQKAVSDWIQSGAPLPALERALEPVFGPVRAAMIASTEVTRVFSEANRAAFESTGLVDQVRWNTAQDDLVCPICAPRDGKLYPVGATSEAPPAHVRCRCWVQPVVSNKALEKKLDAIGNE